MLQPYLQAEDSNSQEAALGELMETHAQPIVRRIVWSRLAGLWDDIDDVCSEIRLELLLRLRRAKADPSANPIKDFSAYVATIATNGCNQYFRRRRPGRTRLKKQIRILVSQEGQFSITTSDEGRVWCGLASPAFITLEPLKRHDLDQIIAHVESDHDLGRLLTKILTYAGAPIDLDSLTEVIARIWRIPEDPHLAGSMSVESVAAPITEPELVIDRRRFTVRLWEEIQGLPRPQRISLLLHLRDHSGNSVLFLFPLCGVASFEQVASTLDLETETLGELWKRLPLDDHSIAGLLNCARQQVINLRMSARKRLANRMRGLR